MTEHILIQLLAHNTWANLRILEVCETLSDAQLDSPPQSAVYGTIRATLHHVVTSQEDYTWMLTRGDHPPERATALSFAELRDSVTWSGDALVALAQDSAGTLAQQRIELTDGYTVGPWVFITQVINHATEHREQIKSMLTALGIAPPRIDGWQYGKERGALIPPR